MSGEQLELTIKSSDSEPVKEQGPAPSAAKPKAATKAKPKASSAPEPLGRPTLYLVDGPNLAFRAHYGIRGLTNSKGQPTNALYGYCSQVFKLLKVLLGQVVA